MFGHQDKINQILRGAETVNKAKDNDIDLELSVSVLTKTLKDVQLERDALWVKTQQDEREINQLRDANKERLIQRTQLIEIAEELADVIIGNGASVKDAIPIDKLDEFCIRWGIKEPFKRNYSA
jgi:hypothetical protein